MAMKWEGDAALRANLQQIIAKSDKAAASALTGLAFDIRQQTRNELPKWVQLTRQFLPNSVVYEKATETNLQAVVGFDKRADFALLLEDGGTRKPANSRTIAVPTEDVRRTNKGGISKANRPAAVMQKPGAFSGIPENAHKQVAGIWRAVKKTLKLLYVYKPQTKYNRKLMHFRDTAEQVVQANHAKRFQEQIERIVKK